MILSELSIQIRKKLKINEKHSVFFYFGNKMILT